MRPSHYLRSAHALRVVWASLSVHNERRPGDSAGPSRDNVWDVWAGERGVGEEKGALADASTPVIAPDACTVLNEKSAPYQINVCTHSISFKGVL